ncbi:hypothetical protein C8J57DRAFT_1240495 [Mycena rebaudengoi]|nr:hypothetical protein C8J57DRAFT_1240495 [Mycena rebaudengoi]
MDETGGSSRPVPQRKICGGVEQVPTLIFPSLALANELTPELIWVPKMGVTCGYEDQIFHWHIFVGDTDSTSGRHTFSAWTSANKNAGRCDSESNLCVFRLHNKIPQTVFDDRAGGFTQSDVQQMCTTAITLNIQENGAVKDGAFVVQTKFGKPICVQHQVAGQGSCFPLGIHATTSKLSSPCKSSGEKAIAGKTTEIAAR